MLMIEKIGIYKARIFIPVLALYFFSKNCLLKNREIDAEMQAYSVILNWELVRLEDGSIFNLKDTFTIVQKNQINMYIISKPFENSYTTYNKNDSIISEKLETGINYNYYLFKEKQAVGIRYDSVNAKKGVKFLVDSFINSKTFFKSDINLDSDYQLNKKIQLTKFSDAEIYYTENKKDENFPDSMYLFFSSSFNKAPYKFSKKLDSTHQKKLFKIQIIYNPLRSDKYSFLLPRRELLFEIQKISISDHDPINKLFARFKELSF